MTRKQWSYVQLKARSNKKCSSEKESNACLKTIRSSDVPVKEAQYEVLNVFVKEHSDLDIHNRLSNMSLVLWYDNGNNVQIRFVPCGNDKFGLEPVGPICDIEVLKQMRSDLYIETQQHFYVNSK